MKPTTVAMRTQHAHTLQALFSHPLQHNLRMSDVEALLLHLNAQIDHLSDHRLRLQLASGETMVLHAAPGLHHPLLGEDGVLRLRHFLERAGITPEHPEPPESHARGDQSKRLVIHLDHRRARLWWLDDNTRTTTTLQPNGVWSSHQRLSHRHDRDIAGQRAPLDYEYLKQLSTAISEADRVLLLGHGRGQSDLTQLLKEHIAEHHPAAKDRLQTLKLDDTAHTDDELLAIAREHFGNTRHRSLSDAPGEKSREAQTNATNQRKHRN